ncbi:hypothetical protein BKA64DRAFT_469653 [Cadophora sp. MPI-SDFR-AT-0126]|nr:hypothetical protein BKA64DRAFT_469653 [Leotiomycetes sp. MPI-SDFR-AT-0126]
MGTFIHLAPKTHDISLASEHIPDIARLGRDLNDAVQAAWHHRHGIRYTKVEALLLRWADDDLGVLTELEDLERVLVNLYFYNVQKYDIPSEKPDSALTRRVLDFLDLDGEETLFILYYAGHGRNGSQYDEGPLWNRSAHSPYLPARGIQSKFEEAFADSLLLYDCCNSAASTTSPSCRGHKGVTEVMAACGYEAIAAEVGEHSFIA